MLTARSVEYISLSMMRQSVEVFERLLEEYEQQKDVNLNAHRALVALIDTTKVCAKEMNGVVNRDLPKAFGWAPEK